VTTGARDLTLSAMSLRKAGFEERLRAAANAGFTSVGLRLSDYRDARAQGLDDDEQLALLARYGLFVGEMEAIWDWVAVNTGSGTEAGRAEQDELLRVTVLYGRPRINLGSFFHHRLDHIVAGFGILCDRAADVGVDIALEFLPYAQVSHLSFCRQVVEDADRVNGRILLDTWHYFRSGSNLELLMDIDASMLSAVQLGDVLPVPLGDPKHEARHLRQLPGEGAGNLTELLRVIAAKGFTGPLAVEIFSDTLDDAGPVAAAERMMGATVRVLELAGWPAP
jgi:sugar phosphate isomerase/epimerase